MGNRFETDVAMWQVISQAVVTVRPEGARRTGCFPLWPEHQVDDEELGLALEEVDERFLAVWGVENVFFLDFGPWHLADLGSERVARTRQFLFLFEDFCADNVPLFARDDFVLRLRHSVDHQ